MQARIKRKKYYNEYSRYFIGDFITIDDTIVHVTGVLPFYSKCVYYNISVQGNITSSLQRVVMTHDFLLECIPQRFCIREYIQEGSKIPIGDIKEHIIAYPISPLRHYIEFNLYKNLYCAYGDESKFGGGKTCLYNFVNFYRDPIKRFLGKLYSFSRKSPK